ncbi:MAG: hypothetical protein IPO27_08035 [Bacteroidetes bacterium]|nr:hypothetical protein [Bacteroidota bacterium]
MNNAIGQGITFTNAPSDISICDNAGSSYEISFPNMQASDKVTITLSVMDGGIVVPVNANEYPSCFGSITQISSSPFLFDMTNVSGVTFQQNQSNYNIYDLEFTTAGTYSLSFNLKLNCSLNGYFSLLNYASPTLNCNLTFGNLSVDVDANINSIVVAADPNNNIVNTLGYLENTSFTFIYNFDKSPASTSISDLTFDWELVSAGVLPFTINKIYINGNLTTLTNPIIGETFQLQNGTNPLTVSIDITMTSCPPGGTQDIQAILKYRCGDAALSTDCNACGEAEKVVNYINISNKKCTIEYERMEPLDANAGTNAPIYQMPYDVSCAEIDDEVLWKYEIRNLANNATVKNMKLQLNENGIANNNLVILDWNTVTVTTAGTGANIISNIPTVYAGQVPACTAQVVSPISGFVLSIEDFKPSTTLTVEFKTKKCCTSDFILFGNLFNKPKNFNQFSLQITGKDICNNNIKVTTPKSNSLYNNGGISTHQNFNNKPPDLDMVAPFTPTVMDVIVYASNEIDVATILNPPIVINNKININDLIGDNGLNDQYDLQAFGYEGKLTGQIPDYENSGLKDAYIRVKISCQSGLQIDEQNNLNTLGIDFTPVFHGAVDWAPDFILPVVDYECGKKHDYYFFYKMEDLFALIGNVNPFTFIESSNFNFKLFACCSLLTSQATNSGDYDLEFSIMHNCTVSPIIIDELNYNSPSICWIPLNKYADHITVNCPGCYAPGLITDSYYMRRKSLGYQDANDNGFTDANQLIQYKPTIADGKSLYNEYDQMSHEIATHGDEIEDHTILYFQDGNVGYGGYNYAAMTAHGEFLDWIQVLREIPLADQSNMNLIVTGLDFYVDENGAGNCIDCPNFESYSDKTTIFEMHINDFQNLSLNIPYQILESGSKWKLFFHNA